MTCAFSWQNFCQPLSCFILYSKAKFACYSKYLLTSYFCIPVPYNEKDIFFGCFKRSYRFSQNHSTSASSALMVGLQTWITVTLNCLPQKRTEIILSFLRLYLSTAFCILLLIMRATPFLLRDSCSQQQMQQSQSFAKRMHWSQKAPSSNNTREDSTHGHHQIVNTKIRLIILFAAEDGEALYSHQKQDQELTVSQIMNSLFPNSE